MTLMMYSSRRYFQREYLIYPPSSSISKNYISRHAQYSQFVLYNQLERCERIVQIIYTCQEQDAHGGSYVNNNVLRTRQSQIVTNPGKAKMTNETMERK